jgi:hypothetical protein
MAEGVAAVAVFPGLGHGGGRGHRGAACSSRHFEAASDVTFR